MPANVVSSNNGMKVQNAGLEYPAAVRPLPITSDLSSTINYDANGLKGHSANWR